MACTQEMLRVNICQNLQVVIQIATKYSDVLGPVGLIKMFESFKTFEGEHYILITIVYVFITSNRFLLLPQILSISVRIQRFTSNISRLPLALVRFEKSSTFSWRATSIIPRKSRTF